MTKGPPKPWTKQATKSLQNTWASHLSLQKAPAGSNLHQIHQHGLIRDLSIRPKPVILYPSFSFLQELWEYRFGGWGVLSKGLRSCCHEPTVLLRERDVHWTRQLSSHACVVLPSENLTFPCHQDADNTPCLHLTHKSCKKLLLFHLIKPTINPTKSSCYSI